MSDITASPVSFDLSLREADGEIKALLTILRSFWKKENQLMKTVTIPTPKAKEGSEEADDAVQEVLKEIETEFAKELTTTIKYPKIQILPLGMT